MTSPFRARKSGASRVVDAIGGIAAIVSIVIDAVKAKRAPRRADEIFRTPLGVDAVPAEGMSTVYRSEPPPRSRADEAPSFGVRGSPAREDIH